ncbi:Carns1, partial [Symbiodinium sp. CCMP2592]
AFVSQLVRRGQDRLLGPLSQEEALKRLQGEKLLRGCDQLTKVLQKVDEVTVADQPLFSQDSSEHSVRTTPLR